MKYRILRDFQFAHEGFQIAAYVANTEREVKDQDFHRIAVAEGWAAPVTEAAPDVREQAPKASKTHKAPKAK